MTDSANDVIASLADLAGADLVDEPDTDVQVDAPQAPADGLDFPDLPSIDWHTSRLGVDPVELGRICNIARADALLAFAERLRRAAWGLGQEGPRWVHTDEGMKRVPAPPGHELLAKIGDAALFAMADVAILEATALLGESVDGLELEGDDS